MKEEGTIASLLLTTEALIAEIPEAGPNRDQAHSDRAEMGGMY